MEWEECRVKSLKFQRQLFAEQEKELSKEEYQRLVYAAKQRGDRRLSLLIETICATGACDIKIAPHNLDYVVRRLKKRRIFLI